MKIQMGEKLVEFRKGSVAEEELRIRERIEATQSPKQAGE
jgi:hypothetical protein